MKMNNFCIFFQITFHKIKNTSIQKKFDNIFFINVNIFFLFLDGPLNLPKFENYRFFLYLSMNNFVAKIFIERCPQRQRDSRS